MDAPDRRPALDAAPLEMGRRVRRLREEQGMSLSELARRANVGKATLSGLENGTRNPTMETLWAVTAQLGVPVATIFGPPAEPLAVHGTAVEATLLQVFEEDRVTFELYRIHLPAGASQTSPAHPGGVTEHLTVFSGVLSAGPATGPSRAGPGEYLTWRADVPHTYAAIGAEDVHAGLLIRYPSPRGKGR
ncbi:XRE family transcriptional regulator [Sphaerisporangium album]|uniref:XRE family transcriptional regulator n=1 Tax=Sphaerisporangium album TaxID=509200 RepID=A0A367FJ91_9ACTN|nr:XRE family transcriptional regulator [Sphaerisporangium album]RCG29705.1 XRE family transcriptional regulator [Sphaerisporangium album]